MAKNELVTVVKGMELANKELEKAVITILTAKAGAESSKWLEATEYNRVLDDDLFSEDFENEKAFASFMGYSPAMMTQFKKAVEFSEKSVMYGDTPLTKDNLTVGKAYSLSALKDDVDKFIEYCIVNDVALLALSDAGIKNVIKDWKKENEAIDSEAHELEEAPTEDASEVEKEEIIEVEYNGMIYGVNVAELVQIARYQKEA